VIAAPAAQVPELVKECGEAGVLGLIIISAGFRETGREGRALEEEILAHKKTTRECGLSGQIAWESFPLISS